MGDLQVINLGIIDNEFCVANRQIIFDVVVCVLEVFLIDDYVGPVVWICCGIHESFCEQNSSNLTLCIEENIFHNIAEENE